jgi:hypothetical protein
MVTLLLKPFPSTILTGVQTFPVTAVDWLRWWGPVKHTIITRYETHDFWWCIRIWSNYKSFNLCSCKNKIVDAIINIISAWKIMPRPKHETNNLGDVCIALTILVHSLLFILKPVRQGLQKKCTGMKCIFTIFFTNLFKTFFTPTNIHVVSLSVWYKLKLECVDKFW